jgi:hypothetical protein
MPQYMQPQPQQQYMQPPQQYMPPVEAPPQMGMPQPGPAYPTDPRLAPPQDPRLAAMAPAPAPAPRPMISLASAGQPPMPMQPAPALQQQQPAPMQAQAPAVPDAGMAAEQQQGEGWLQLQLGLSWSLPEPLRKLSHLPIGRDCSRPLTWVLFLSTPCPCHAALLQQVLSLTPQQIELLPPQQRAQVQALQAQLVSTHVCLEARHNGLRHSTIC